jgi:hypothetical protein
MSPDPLGLILQAIGGHFFKKFKNPDDSDVFDQIQSIFLKVNTPEISSTQTEPLSSLLLTTKEAHVVGIMYNFSFDYLFPHQETKHFIKAPKQTQKDGEVLHPAPHQLT